MDSTGGEPSHQGKNSIESLSKEEIISKYKGLLGIAKKAKQAKDEYAEENRNLKEALSRCETQKEADKNALMTMKEMLEQFTENKLELTSQLSELQKKSKSDDVELANLRIENESLKRQLDRLNEDNESLLNDIDRMEDQLKQVNLLGMEQKKHLGLLEVEVNKLKEAENLSACLQSQMAVAAAENKAIKEQENATKQALEELTKKYQQVKEITGEQRKKFNALRDRFVEVHRKVKQLKECKRILLETQHEYSEAVTKWQREIIQASQQLYAQMNALKNENEELQRRLLEAGQEKATHVKMDVDGITAQLKTMQLLSERALEEQNEKNLALMALQEEIKNLKEEKRSNEQQLRCLQNKEKIALEVLDMEEIALKLKVLQELSGRVLEEQNKNNLELTALKEENKRLKEERRDNVEAAGEKVELKATSVEQLEAASGAKPNKKLKSKLLSQELQDLKIKMQDGEENLKVLLSENEQLKLVLKQQATLEQEIQRLSTELTAYKDGNHDTAKGQTRPEELEECAEKLSSLEEERLASKEQFGVMQTELADLRNKLKQYESLSEEKERLSQQMQGLTDTLNENSQLREDLQQIRSVIKTLEEEKVELLAQARQQQPDSEYADTEDAKESTERAAALQIELQESRRAIEELQSRYEQKEREHADLLGEMRELNEALKARGDVISRQQEKHQELSAELKRTTARLQQIEDALDEKEQSITQKDEQVRDINMEIDAARNKVQSLEEVCMRNEEHVRALTEELHTLRHADCQSDVLSTSTMSRGEELSRMRDVDESFEEKYNKLRGLAVKLKRKLQEQTAYVAEMEKQQSSSAPLRKELDECKKKLVEAQAEQEKCQKQVESLKTENQKLKSSRKQTNVLNLEIEAAEKSLNEATAKLTAKVSELETLNERLATKENTNVQLRKEILILEAAKDAECTHSKELKEQIDRLQTQIKDALHSKQNVLVSSKELEQSYENLKLELEDVRLELANSASKHEAALSAVNANNATLAEKLQQTEENLKESQSNLKVAERSLEDLRVEYLEYKVKAQAVLRKNQSKDTSKERELEEELNVLRATEKQLQVSSLQHIKQIEDGDKEMELLREDNESLQRRSKELLNLVEELREQNENLAQENRNHMQIQQDALRTHRQQIESLDTCHKDQLQSLEENYQRQMDQLKAEHAKLIRMPPIIGAARSVAQPLPAVASSEQSKIDFLLMEREDAEGSEEAEALANLAANRKISNASRRSQHDFMPLDELLNAPMTSISSDTVTTIAGGINLGRSDSYEGESNSAEKMHVELQATKERLQIQESRERHLTALLAENEQDLAKLTQMNDMLKEELRRQERGVEREKHMHNSEYLKNVILKFLTLNNGDERTRLVPVLNTILRLSRAEADMLNCVAKGQKVNTESKSSGWSSFLPSWSNNNNN